LWNDPMVALLVAASIAGSTIELSVTLTK